MIKFFRQIRQRLLIENPTNGRAGRYLLYAIGEIVLVVIGILIALQINNWNESRKKEENELQIYHQIITDLDSEYLIIEGLIRVIIGGQIFYSQLYEESQGKAIYDPTTSYNELFYVFAYDMFFNEKYTESLSEITDGRTHEILKNYIKQEKRNKSSIDEYNTFKIEEIRPFLEKHGIKNTKEVFKIKSNDFKLMSTTQLIDYPRLKKQYGTLEFDQLLFTLRFKTTWLLENLNLTKEVNREFKVSLGNKLGIVEQNESTLMSTPIKVGMLLTEDKTIDEIIEIIRTQSPDKPVYDISENAINVLGYYLMDEKRLHEALKIFKLGTELYPDGYNIYDSYGECLYKLQDYKNSIKAYQRALELNPDNESSKKMLKYLTTKEQ